MINKMDWNMNEEAYLLLKNTVLKTIKNNTDNFFGNITIGNLLVEFNHTLDHSDYYAFSSGYVTGDEYQNETNYWYGTALEGTSREFNYEQCPELDDINVDGAIKTTSTFEAFKKQVESEILKVFETYPAIKAKADKPNTYWVREKQYK